MDELRFSTEIRDERRAHACSRKHFFRRAFQIGYGSFRSIFHPFVEREFPKFFKSVGLRSVRYPFHHFLIVSDHAGIIVSKPVHTCARKRGDGNDGLRRFGFRNVGDDVGEHEASFGVGMSDFHGFSVPRLQDIERFHGRASKKVFRQPHCSYDIFDKIVERVQIPHGGDNRGSAGHIGLHILHRFVVLDLQSSRIERYALSENGAFNPAVHALSFENDRERRFVASGGNRKQATEAELFHGILVENFDVGPLPVERFHDVRDFRRILVGRRSIDQITRETDGGKKPDALFERFFLFGRRSVFTNDDQASFTVFFVALIRIEPVRTERENVGAFDMVASERAAENQIAIQFPNQFSRFFKKTVFLPRGKNVDSVVLSKRAERIENEGFFLRERFSRFF